MYRVGLKQARPEISTPLLHWCWGRVKTAKHKKLCSYTRIYLLSIFLSWIIYGHCRRTKMYLQAKFNFQAFCSFRAIVRRKNGVISNPTSHPVISFDIGRTSAYSDEKMQHRVFWRPIKQHTQCTPFLLINEQHRIMNTPADSKNTLCGNIS